MKLSVDANNLALGDCLDALNIETIFQLLTQDYLSWETLRSILDDLRRQTKAQQKGDFYVEKTKK